MQLHQNMLCYMEWSWWRIARRLSIRFLIACISSMAVWGKKGGLLRYNEGNSIWLSLWVWRYIPNVPSLLFCLHPIMPSLSAYVHYHTELDEWGTAVVANSDGRSKMASDSPLYAECHVTFVRHCNWPNRPNPVSYWFSLNTSVAQKHKIYTSTHRNKKFVFTEDSLPMECSYTWIRSTT